ncbi:MAG: cyclic nucleotide-binding domain-containing protein [Anaerolineales bacterium]|nr:cyclic nucleotide-binding domain-containing protein [Anaerolineales bacterium]
MTPETPSKVDFLRQVRFFKDLEPSDLAQIAARLEESSRPAEEVVFKQGEAGDYFYIILSGEVLVLQQDGDQEQELIRLHNHDTFGEEALYFDQPRSATIKTLTNTEFYYLTKANFDWMLRTFPAIEPYLSVYANSYRLARRYKLEWLGKNEMVAIMDRRHPIRLIIDLWWVTLGIFFLLAIIAVLGFVTSQLGLPLGEQSVLWWIGGFIVLLGLALWVWAIFEWRNDFFVVTNIRVVWRERILLRSSSRQEAPLRQIQSLNTQTRSIFERMFKVGDVTVRTFNSTLIMTDVRRPVHMVKIIEDYMLRARRRKQQVELEQIRYTIRQRLGFSDDEAEPPVLEEQVPTAVTSNELFFNPFKTRVQQGKVINYRKHWSVFLGHAWLPLLSFSLVLLATFLSLILYPNWNLVLVEFLVILILVGWLGYHYIDWLNDLYQLTEDRIIDREKKPLGKELTRSAPLKNIQSLGHEIPNLLGLILNVGTVRINVGDDTLDFGGVHNPALVHQDISRYMEDLIRREEQAKDEQERNRMATWLEIYHDEAEQQRRSERRWDFG